MPPLTIPTEGGVFKAECFGFHQEGNTECGKCPVRDNCQAQLHNNLKRALGGVEKFAPKAEGYLLANKPKEDNPDAIWLTVAKELQAVHKEGNLEIGLSAIEGLNAGSYTNPTIEVDDFGRIKNITSNPIPAPVQPCLTIGELTDVNSFDNFSQNQILVTDGSGNYVQKSIDDVITSNNSSHLPISNTSGNGDVVDHGIYTLPQHDTDIFFNTTFYSPPTLNTQIVGIMGHPGYCITSVNTTHFHFQWNFSPSSTEIYNLHWIAHG